MLAAVKGALPTPMVLERSNVLLSIGVMFEEGLFEKHGNVFSYMGLRIIIAYYFRGEVSLGMLALATEYVA